MVKSDRPIDETDDDLRNAARALDQPPEPDQIQRILAAVRGGSPSPVKISLLRSGFMCLGQENLTLPLLHGDVAARPTNRSSKNRAL